MSLAQGAAIDSPRVSDGWTPLHVVATTKNYVMACFLILNMHPIDAYVACDFVMQSISLSLSFYTSISYDFIESLHFSLTKDEHRRTPLHIAAYCGCAPMVGWLYKYEKRLDTFSIYPRPLIC